MSVYEVPALNQVEQKGGSLYGSCFDLGALIVATHGFIYYTIIRDKPPFKQVQEDYDTPFNPGYWLYRRTVGWWLEGLAD